MVVNRWYWKCCDFSFNKAFYGNRDQFVVCTGNGFSPSFIILENALFFVEIISNCDGIVEANWITINLLGSVPIVCNTLQTFTSQLKPTRPCRSWCQGLYRFIDDGCWYSFDLSGNQFSTYIINIQWIYIYVHLYIYEGRKVDSEMF